MIVSIHQPNYIPWAGYFHKIANSDVFVIFDDVQFPRGKDWIFRNKIKTESGEKWLSVPVKNKNKFLKINEIEINNDIEWQKKHINALYSNYQKAEFFSMYFEDLEDILNKKWRFLIEMNLEIIHTIMKILDIKTKIVLSSELNVKDTGTMKIIKTVKKLNGDKYFTSWGKGSKRYIEGFEEKFDEYGINIIRQEVKIPEYKQLFGNFLPELSIVDMLFNINTQKTREIINM
tara:strand:+ start:1063 stop:1758 length:696 start_codon:yes stop_codon:yes gene_type:complete